MACSGSVFIATSADGFIATLDGSVDWLNEANEKMPMTGEDRGCFGSFLESVGAIVMGRKTFESCLTLCTPETWPYGDTPVVVLTRNIENCSVQIPEKLKHKVSLANGSPSEILGLCIEKFGAQDVYVDGGETIRRFLEAGLIKRAIITIVPVSIGEGLPLFSKAQKNLLEEVEVKKMSNGFIQTTYTVK